MARTTSTINGLVLYLVGFSSDTNPLSPTMASNAAQQSTSVSPSPYTNHSNVSSYGKKELNVFLSGNNKQNESYFLGTMVNSTNDNSTSKSPIDRVIEQVTRTEKEQIGGFHPQFEVELHPHDAEQHVEQSQPVTSGWNTSSHQIIIPRIKTVRQRL